MSDTRDVSIPQAVSTVATMTYWAWNEIKRNAFQYRKR